MHVNNNKTFITACQRSFGKVMFSLVSVSPRGGGGGSHVTITPNTLDLTVQALIRPFKILASEELVSEIFKSDAEAACSQAHVNCGDYVNLFPNKGDVHAKVTETDKKWLVDNCVAVFMILH